MQYMDERWFERTKEIVFDVSEIYRFNASMQLSRKERELFLSNEIENPRISYNCEALNVVAVDVRVDALKQEIAASETESLVADFYYEKLDRQVERALLLQATASGDDAAFFASSKVVYGAPKKKYFAYVAARTLSLIETHQKHHPAAAKRLKKVLGKIDVSDLAVDVSMLPSPVKGGKPLQSLAQAIEILQAALDRFGVTGWTIVTREDQLTHFAVDPNGQVIKVPQEELFLSRNLTDVAMRGLAEHEVGVHVRRAFEATKQPLQLLQIGLDHYLKGEEGVASYVQQQLEGAKEFYGFERYLAASLAVGMDGEPRDFRAVFSLMTDYYALKHAELGIDIPPFKPAWDVCVRIFRGTSGTTPGTIYTKDIIYLEGNIGVWNLMSEKPHIFESLFLGKFNPLLTRHVKSLEMLGIIKEW